MLSVGSSSVYSLFSLLSITSSLGSSSITDESDVFSSLLISEFSASLLSTTWFSIIGSVTSCIFSSETLPNEPFSTTFPFTFTISNVVISFNSPIFSHLTFPKFISFKLLISFNKENDFISIFSKSLCSFCNASISILVIAFNSSFFIDSSDNLPKV